MRNLADIIESVIVKQLLEDRENRVLVQRNELADRLSCAPSQISYVISTRFTPERGYMVESRRGSGGFVRIVRVLTETGAADREIHTTAENMVKHLAVNRVVSPREEALLNYMLEIVSDQMGEYEKKAVLNEAVLRISGKEYK